MAELVLERDAAPGIHRIEDAHTNWFLVEGDDRELLIVDCGVPTSWRSLNLALAELGRRTDDLRAILLTHAHFDHVGFADRARRELGPPVWLHAADVELSKHPARHAHERSRIPYLLTRPRALPIIASLVLNRAFFAAPVGEVRTFEADLPALPGGPRLVPTPGHTFGHCSFAFPERDALIVGDALVSLDPYTGARGPRLVARAATADTRRATDSLDAVAATGAATVLTGHGPVLRDGADAAAERARAAGAA